MNKLTERLLAEGYTKENHPDHVEWSNWQDFEYTREYLAKTVWETPCGLLKKGIGSYNHGSHMGVDYCPENDNPRYGCPYYDEQPCPHRFNKFWGWNCTYHQTDRLYDYEQSVEKLWDEWDKIRHQAWQEIGGYCDCMEWNRPKRKYVPRFNIDKCIKLCNNQVCLITKKTRNLEKVNIFYDVLREKHYRIGLVENTERTIEKGVRVFDRAVARTDAETWLKINMDKIFRPKKNDRCDLHFSEYHGKTGFGEYDFFEFKATVQNIRIEKRESRDLLQDLQDAREGIEVIHTSDIIKSAAKAKKQRRKEYQENKAKRQEKRKIANWQRCLTDKEAAKAYAEENGVNVDLIREHAAKELERRRIVIEKKLEQISLFDYTLNT